MRATITHNPPQQHAHSTRKNKEDGWGERHLCSSPFRPLEVPKALLSLRAEGCSSRGGCVGSSGWCYIEVWRSVKGDGEGSVGCGWGDSMWISNYILLIVSTNASRRGMSAPEPKLPWPVGWKQESFSLSLTLLLPVPQFTPLHSFMSFTPASIPYSSTLLAHIAIACG